MSSKLDKRNFIDVDALPHKNINVDWKKSIGHTIDFRCAENEGTLTIIDHYPKERKICVDIGGKHYIMSTDTLLNCGFGRRIFKKENLNYKYNIGDIIDVNGTQYKVLEQTRNKFDRKCYKVICLRCNEITHKLENQLSHKYGCTVCARRKIKRGINDLWTIDSETAKLLYNKEDGYINGIGSSKKVDWICPICQTIIKDKIISDVYKQGLCCPICGKSKSYPNKLMFAILKDLEVNFKGEKTFDWANGKRYDFYLHDFDTIIEMNGKQHYDVDFFDSCENVKKNDGYKKKLALDNGILEKNYVQIDARYSDFNYIINNIFKSELKNILNLDDVNWEHVGNITASNPLKEACRLWDEGNHDIQSIADTIGYHLSKTSLFLRRGAKLGMTTYTKEESNNNGFQKSRNTWYQNHGIPFLCNWKDDIYYFGSYTVFQNNSEKVFAKKVEARIPSDILSGKQIKTRDFDFTFSYISREEFNSMKTLYPDKCFGDYFIITKSA